MIEIISAFAMLGLVTFVTIIIRLWQALFGDRTGNAGRFGHVDENERIKNRGE
jgi:uncharacterized membrane protein